MAIQKMRGNRGRILRRCSELRERLRDTWHQLEEENPDGIVPETAVAQNLVWAITAFESLAYELQAPKLLIEDHVPTVKAWGEEEEKRRNK